MMTKTDYLEGASLQLDLWGDQFQTLEEKVAAAGRRGRRELARRFHALRRRKQALQSRLRQAAHGSTQTQWEDVREDLEEAVDDFRSLAIEVLDDVEKA